MKVPGTSRDPDSGDGKVGNMLANFPPTDLQQVFKSIPQASPELPAIGNEDDAQLTQPLGKRTLMGHNQLELEQHLGHGDRASELDPVRLTAEERRKPTHQNRKKETWTLEGFAMSLVDDKLKEPKTWSGDLRKKKAVAEPDLEESARNRNDLREALRNRRKLEESSGQTQVTKKKPDSIWMEEESPLDKIVKREDPLKTKNPNCDEVYYPEDFLVKGVLNTSNSSKSNANKRYVDVRDELAHPLSQKVVLRNENTIKFQHLDGRLFKYFTENNLETRSLQYVANRSEEGLFVDLKTKEEILEEKLDRKRLFLMQTPVFVFLDEAAPELAILLKEVRADPKKYSYLEYDGEWVWPAFLLCESDAEISKALLSVEEMADPLSEFDCGRLRNPTTSEEGVLVHYFATNYYTRTNYANLLPFEKIMSSSILSRLKKENFMLRYVKFSFYYFRLLAEKEEQVTVSNCKYCLFRLVIVEDATKSTRYFGILLGLKKTDTDKVFAFVRYLDSQNPGWVNLEDKSTKVWVSFNFPEVGMSSVKAMKNDYTSSSASTNKILTTIINTLLGDYYVAHNKSIEFTKKIEWKTSLDDEKVFTTSEMQKKKCTKCSYTLSIFDYLNCRNCKKVYHKYCLESSTSETQSFQDLVHVKSSIWVCSECRECKYCLGYKDRAQMITCIDCKGLVHTYCVLNTASSNKDNFRCDDCLKCHNCEVVGEDKHFTNIPNENYKVCLGCSPRYQSNEYCPVCCKCFQFKTKTVKSKKYIKDVFFCECGFGVHQDCDPLLRRNPANQNEARKAETVYNCPKCRVCLKKTQTKMFFQILTMFDPKQFFTPKIDPSQESYYRIISNPIFVSTMIENAELGAYIVDTVNKVKTDMDLLWSNIITFNMPNTEQYLDGFKFNIFANYALDFFKETLAKPVEEYLFDKQENFLIRKFFEFKNNLLKYYLDLISKDYGRKTDISINGVFEEKDKRSICSKERNKMNHLLNNIKLKHLKISDLYEFESLLFKAADLESKTLTLEIKGLNMMRMDYSDLDYANASPALKNFLKIHTHSLKRSARKASVGKFGLNEMSAEFGNSGKLSLGHGTLKLTTSKSNNTQGSPDDEELLDERSGPMLTAQDAGVINQLEYWLYEHRRAVDHQFLISYEMSPVPIKITQPAETAYPTCLISGVLEEAGSNNPMIVSCRVCKEYYNTEYMTGKPFQLKDLYSTSKAREEFVCPNCQGCLICRQHHYKLAYTEGSYKETDHKFMVRCNACLDQYHFSCVYPEVIANQDPPILDLWKCEKCFKCLGCGSNSYLDFKVFQSITVSEILFDLWTQSLCYKCALTNGRQLFCCQSGKFCFGAQTDLKEFLAQYRELTSAAVPPDGLICKDSLKVIQVRSLMKLELNRIDKSLYLEGEHSSADMLLESHPKPEIRGLFLQILDKYTQDSYVCHESLEKARLLSDSTIEARKKQQQLELKQQNQEFSKNFKLLTETLKICLEHLVLQDHAAAIREIFGITESHNTASVGPHNGSINGNKDQASSDQDLMHTLIPNFLAYFARTRLRYLAEKPEIMFMIMSISGQRIDISHIAKEWGQHTASTTSGHNVSGIPESWLKYLFMIKERGDSLPRRSMAQTTLLEQSSTRKNSNKWAVTPDKRTGGGEHDPHVTPSRGNSFTVPMSAERNSTAFGLNCDQPDEMTASCGWSLRDQEFRRFLDQFVHRQPAGYTGTQGSVAINKTDRHAVPSSSAQVNEDHTEQMMRESLPDGEDQGGDIKERSEASEDEDNLAEDETTPAEQNAARKHSESANQLSALTAEFKMPETPQLQMAPHQQLADIQIPVDTVGQMCKSIIVGAELLKAEFFRTLVEYHKKREDDRNRKKEVLKKSLYNLADEVHTVLRKELDACVSTSDRKSSRMCILCEGADDHKVCGKLIHLRKEEWIHSNCALWSEGVMQIYGGGLSNMYQMIKKVKGNICPECGKGGASMAGHSDSNKRYHLVCALKNKCVFSVKGEKRIMNLDVWVKNSLNYFQKHFKNCSILYFLFCLSLEMITTFKNNRKVFVQKKQSKGIAEPARTETLTDLSTSLRELASTRRHTRDLVELDGDQLGDRLAASVENGQMSRIGNLMILGVWDITQLNSSNSDISKTLEVVTSVRKQWIKLLRKEGLPQYTEYTAEQKELLCLVLRRYMVARMVPNHQTSTPSGRDCCFHVYELDINPTRAPSIFSLKLTKLSRDEFLSQLEQIQNIRDPDFTFESSTTTQIEFKNLITVMFEEMGLKYSEVRSFLNLHLKSQMDKYLNLQLSSKNMLHYKNYFYNCVDEQQILLDIREKYSIYDRIKLIWQINSDLESSREFIKEMGFAQDPRRFGTRSKINPKSRSFCDRSLENLNNSDGSRGSEKLINELIGNAGMLMNTSKQNQDGVGGFSSLNAAAGGRGRAGLGDRGFGGKKQTLLQNHPSLPGITLGTGQILPPVTFSKGGPEKNLSAILRKGYNSHKTTNVVVAPSNIHKYGLFAGKDFLKDEFVVEYIGEIIRIPVSDIREHQYEMEGFRDCFMFRIQGTDLVIDATFVGNQARYLNHSCDPNCGSIVEEIDGHHKLFIYALKNIAHGEELTYDYKFEVEAEKLRCLCGSSNCLGRLN